MCRSLPWRPILKLPSVPSAAASLLWGLGSHSPVFPAFASTDGAEGIEGQSNGAREENMLVFSFQWLFE